MNINEEFDLEAKLRRDIKYIENDIITRQLREDHKKREEEDEKEKYIKFSKVLNAVAIVNMTKKQYKGYWNTQYSWSPEKLKIIMETIDKKFKEGLTEAEKMQKLIINSHDFESEKENALKYLKPKMNIKDYIVEAK